MVKKEENNSYRKDESIHNIINILAANFDIIPENIRYKSLIKLAANDEVYNEIANIIANNFEKINENLRNELLLKLSEKDETAGNVVRAVASNFDKIPENIRNELLIKLSEKDKATSFFAQVVASNFDKISDNIRNELLIKLSEKDKVAYSFSQVVASNFDKIPENIRNELLIKLSEKDKAAYYVIKAIEVNFDKISENIRNELLLKLSEKNRIAGILASVLKTNFDKIPEDTRNELLLKLYEKENAAETVVFVILFNFNDVSENIRNLLLRLYENEKTAYYVIKAIEVNFDKIPESIRNEFLYNLPEDDRIAGCVARALKNNFENISKNLRNELLLKLSEKDNTAKDVARALARNFERIPENLRNELLLKLSEKDNAAKDVARAITCNFNTLPENVRGILFKLSDKEGTAESVAQAVEANFDKIPENIRNELLIKLSKKQTSVKTIAQIIKLNFDKIPDNVRNKLLLRTGKVKDSTDIGSKSNKSWYHLAPGSAPRGSVPRGSTPWGSASWGFAPSGSAPSGSVPSFKAAESFPYRGWMPSRVHGFYETHSLIPSLVNRFDKKQEEKSSLPSDLEKIELSSVKKLADINFPDRIKLNKHNTLTLRLISEETDQITDDLRLLFCFAEGIEEIEIFVSLEAEDFEIEQPKKKMIVPRMKNSEPLVFYLTPKSIGEKHIQLKFYQNDNYNGEISLKTNVYQEETNESISKVIPKGKVGVYLSNEKNQDMLIEVEINDDHLQFEVTSEILGLFHKKYLSEDQLHEARQFMNETLKEMSNISSVSYNDEEKYKRIFKNVEIIGKDLYKKLIPKDLKEVLWNNRDKINSIFIVVGEEGDGVWIPWEIMKPFRITENNKMETDDFFGAKYIITRWISGPFPPNYITVRNSAVIVNSYNGKLENVNKEKEIIERIFKSKDLGIISIVPKKFEILDAISDESAINILHFAVDCNYEETSPDNSYIRLDEGEKLTPRDIGVNSLNGKPLIFMNACQSGRIDYTYSGIGGFIKAFLDIGASAFVGTTWKVPDSLSKEFSEEFYKNVFENEMSLGEALRETKRKFSISKNPAWLSYTLYGLPLEKIDFTKEVLQ